MKIQNASVPCATINMGYAADLVCLTELIFPIFPGQKGGTHN